MDTGTIKRPHAVTHAGAGVLRGAARLVDITPEPAVVAKTGVAGFSRIAHKTTHDQIEGRLYAAVLLVEGADGERVALVGVDLHSGTTYLTEKTAELSFAAGAGLTADRVVLFASHTHTATGGLFGVRAYDKWCSTREGFRQQEADRVAGLIARGLGECAESLQPVQMSLAVVGVHGLWANRSRKAFDANGTKDPSMTKRVVALHGAAATLDGDQTRCDPRVRVLRMHDATGQLLGALAFVPAHPTAISPFAGIVSSDTFGFAASAMERHLAGGAGFEADGERSFPIAYVMAHAADANVEHPQVATIMSSPSPPRDRGTALGRLAEQKGGTVLSMQIGALIARATASAFAQGAALEQAEGAAQVRCRYGSKLGALATRTPLLGKITRGASEFGRYFFHQLKGDGTKEFFGEFLAHHSPAEGTRARVMIEPDHHPKKVAVINNPGYPTRAPRRVIDIGNIRIGATSFEVSTTLGVRILDALAPPGSGRVAVLGTVAGGYTSYASTRAEYNRQHYEGASNLYGRGTGDWLVERMTELAQMGDSTPPVSGVYTYPVTPSG